MKLENLLRKENLLQKKVLATIIIIAILSFIPTSNDLYVTHLIIMITIYGMIAVSWDLTLGYGGTFNWAQTAFFAVGAYASAIAVKFLGVSPFLGLLIGGPAAALAGIIIGLPCLRLRGIYLCLFTFAFWQFALVFVLYPPLTPYTGGSYGLTAIPKFFAGDAVFNRVASYYLAIGLFLINFFLLNKVVNSRIGLALTALRESESYALSRGINPTKYKLLAFVIGAFFAGIAGSFYAHYVGELDMNIMGWDLLFLILTGTVIGGIGTLWGPLFGSGIITIFSELTRAWKEWKFIFLGALLIVLIIYLPRGLAQIPDLVKRIKTKNSIAKKVG